ncbi:DUF6152 family protein [Sphingobium subterraneum]|uniref:Uncharacterized protein n=1 Tax=Sphingobium subterraneum TaxID=627688 RepID=A0A841IYL9_9SPHN|nr:DUF6152 family protein [Sphingobium subterraneum]MBB6123420.1 hypothetical protein [Sphingobium subterraneum]
MKKILIALSAFSSLLVPIAAIAHHSFADYDDKKKLTLTGTLTEVEFRNPHIRLGMDVKRGGKVEQWEFSGPSPIDWRREGWVKSDFVVGQPLTITGFPKRDGSKHLSVNILKNAAGKTFGQEVK